MKDGFAQTSVLLTQWGTALLIATFGYSLIQAMRSEKDLTECIERLVIGVLFLTFAKSWAGTLDDLSDSLVANLKRYAGENSLKEVILAGLDRAGRSVPRDKVFLPILEQVWRTGVWGILEAVVEFLFLTVGLLIECGKEVLWSLVLVLFPLGCGVYPVFPRIMTNMALYLVQLALWAPLLCIVRAAAGSVAQGYLKKDGTSLGLDIVGIELVAIVLILSIPAVSHRLIAGAFSGDFGSGSSVMSFGKRFAVRSLRGISK